MGKILDLFCGGGASSLGYHRAGFEVTGVDVNPNIAKVYPYQFICADALSIIRDKVFIDSFDFIHANLPFPLFPTETDMNLVRVVRDAMLSSGKMFCVMSVLNAPIRRDIVLDGRMFGLKVIRQRAFYFHDEILVMHPHISGNKTLKAKDGELVIVASNSRSRNQKKLNGFNGSIREERLFAMDIDIPMSLAQTNKAIPPAYTKYIGECLMYYMK